MCENLTYVYVGVACVCVCMWVWRVCVCGCGVGVCMLHRLCTSIRKTVRHGAVGVVERSAFLTDLCHISHGVLKGPHN